MKTMPRLVLIGFLIVFGGCSPGARPSVPAPTASVPQREIATAVISRPVSRADLQDYCASRSSETEGDSVVVSPSAAFLRVGEVLSLETFSTTSAVTGEHLPVHYAVDPPLARIGSGGVRALAAGTTYLRARFLCGTVMDSVAIPVTAVRITIQP